MRLLADLHTHTVASGHGYSTVTEVASAAATRGLELVAVTDHGPNVPGGAHLWYFWNMKVIPSVLNGVRILKGCEANPCLETENGIDLPDEMLSMLDFVAVGLHPQCGFDEGDRVKNTEALLRVIENPFVDMITHPGNEAEFPVDIDAAVAAAVRHGVILELNNYSFDPRSGRNVSVAREREFAETARDAGASIAVNSDAHYHMLVGEFSNALAVAEELAFPEDRIVNRSAASVLEFLDQKRDRPRIDAGGVW
jgi:putative hydrolase